MLFNTTSAINFVLLSYIKTRNSLSFINTAQLQLSIIIVNYNVRYFLEQCLCSVYKAIEQVDAEVWVVDNASSDDSMQFLEPLFPWVKFIANQKNTGFAKANNQALFKCSGKYVLFLNPDTLLPEDSLAKCIAFIETNKQAGAVGVRMIDGSGTFLPESKRSFPSPLNSAYKLLGLSRLFPASKVFSNYSLPYLDEYKNYNVDVLSGAFMLVKKDVLIKLKGFDEAFFMYGEDIDLSYRIQKLGYENYYFSETTIIHFKGESTRRGSLKYVKAFYGAMSIFVKKHYTGVSAFLFASFIHTLMWLRAGASAALQFNLKTILFLLKALRTFGGLQKENKKIKKLPKTIIAGNKEEYEEVKTLLAKAGLEKSVVERSAINEEKDNTLVIFSDLKALAESGKITEIIFCMGEVTCSCIINTIQLLPKKISFRFHAKGTQGIVGSDSKNTSGEVVYAGKYAGK